MMSKKVRPTLLEPDLHTGYNKPITC
jgi:hypothetical protein